MSLAPRIEADLAARAIDAVQVEDAGLEPGGSKGTVTATAARTDVAASGWARTVDLRRLRRN
jgi:hypothetical protein